MKTKNTTVGDFHGNYKRKDHDVIDTKDEKRTDIAKVEKQVTSKSVKNKYSRGKYIGDIPDNIGAIPLKTVAPFY